MVCLLIELFCCLAFVRIGLCHLAHVGHGESGAGGFEDGGAGYDDVGAGCGGNADVLLVNAAVYLNVDGELVLVKVLAELFDLVKGGVDDALSAEAGVNGHDEDHVYEIQIGDDHVPGSVGGDGQGCTHLIVAQMLEDLAAISAAFVVNGDAVGTGADEVIYVTDGVHDHQVYVEKQLGLLAKSRHHAGTEADVGHKGTVHNVKVKIIGAAVLHALDVLGEVGKVGGEQRGSKVDHRSSFQCGRAANFYFEGQGKMRAGKRRIFGK